MKRAGLALALIAILVTTLFLAAMFQATEGRFIPQVVDLYLILQYARSIGEGHAFHYNPGDAATTGSTSLLYTLILGLMNKAGIRGEGLVAACIALGATSYFGAVFLARRIGLLLADAWTGLLAGVLVALGGPLVWGFFYGSDLGLFAFLMLLLLERFLSEWEAPLPVGTVVAACFLSIARPEGLPVAILFGAGFAFGRRRTARFGGALLWLPTVVALGVLGFYKWLTGSWLGTSIEDKSLFANYSFADAIALASEYVVDVIRGLLLGFYPGQAPVGFARGWGNLFFPPLGLLLVAGGYASLQNDERRRPVGFWLLLVTAVALLTVPNTYMGVHFHRYILWTLPGLLTLVACGLTRGLRGAGIPRALRHFLAGLVLVLSLLGTLRFAALYGEMAGTTYRRDFAMAQWIRGAIASGQLPQRARIANLATSIEFVAGYESINLHGVTAPAFMRVRKAEREASVYEILTRQSREARPDFLLTSSEAQAAYPSMSEFVVEPPLHGTSSLTGSDLLLYRMRYDNAATAHGALQDPNSIAATAAMRLVDSLNVCDPQSEKDHEYEYSSRFGDLALNGTVHAASYPEAGRLLDGGRVIFGHESFVIRTDAAKPLLIVARMAALNEVGLSRPPGVSRQPISIQSPRIEVTLDDRPPGVWQAKLGDGWMETTIVVPGNQVSGARTRIRLSGRYPAYQYWFFQ